jgi:hypothetical protein
MSREFRLIRMGAGAGDLCDDWFFWKEGALESDRLRVRLFRSQSCARPLRRPSEARS